MDTRGGTGTELERYEGRAVYIEDCGDDAHGYARRLFAMALWYTGTFILLHDSISTED
jgi:hypothetical protein